MFIFTNIKLLRKSLFLEYPSVVRGQHLIEAEKDHETGDIIIWIGRIHGVISPTYG